MFGNLEERAHERPNGTRLPPVHSIKLGDEPAAEELAEERDDDYADAPAPDAAVGEEAKVRFESTAKCGSS